MQTSQGAHDGYAGISGTYVLRDGQRIPVDPVSLQPLSNVSAPTHLQSSETKPAAAPVKKAVPAANKTE
jgi:hypothetical protein